MKKAPKPLALFLTILMLSGFIPLLGNPALDSSYTSHMYSPSQFSMNTISTNMNVTTFVSPDGSKDALWHFLNSAEESIYVEIYGINNPYILELIHELHDTKPTLEMKFLLGWNSLGYTSENDYVANNLTNLGYEVKWTNDAEFTFAHQKFVIIDNETTIIHSGNWAKTSFPEPDNKANREWSIAMTDTQVTDFYRSVFDYDWGNGIDYDSGAHGTGSPLTYTGTSSTYSNPFATAGTFSGAMNVTPIVSPDTSLQGILYCINAAQATLDIQIPYFTSVGDEGAVDQIIEAILAAKDRGVTVRVISEEEKDWIEIEEIFLEHDIPIVWQDTRWFTANHNKGIIVDGRMVLVSSINYSDGSITENREAGVIIENEDVAQWYLDVFDFDWAIAGAESLDDVNVYWTPNIPKSSTEINVTVYGHELYNDIDEVELAIRINSGAWNNVTITDNITKSAEDDLENYFYLISGQPDMTNITVVGKIREGSTWHEGVPMVIRVRDSLGSVAPTIPTPPPEPTLMDLIIENLLLIIIGTIAVVCSGISYKYRKAIKKKFR
ncbi:MAG: hypothetical protein BAJATHORv1_30252 [Candidatus Thorarchaeota archaeon]|nr:MAG: hypothetical protein BAJATHORv1_30252 [Candidatus Thorarchaeota archaeon]